MSSPSKCPVCGAKKMYEHTDSSVSFACGGNSPHTPCPGAIRAAIERGEKIEEMQAQTENDTVFAYALISAVSKAPTEKMFIILMNGVRHRGAPWNDALLRAARQVIRERTLVRDPGGQAALAEYDALHARVNKLESTVALVKAWDHKDCNFEWPENIRTALYDDQPSQESPAS